MSRWAEWEDGQCLTTVGYVKVLGGPDQAALGAARQQTPGHETLEGGFVPGSTGLIKDHYGHAHVDLLRWHARANYYWVTSRYDSYYYSLSML